MTDCPHLLSTCYKSQLAMKHSEINLKSVKMSIHLFTVTAATSTFPGGTSATSARRRNPTTLLRCPRWREVSRAPPPGPQHPHPHPLRHRVHRPRRLVQQGASEESGGAASTAAASGAAAATVAASEEGGAAVAASGGGSPRERWTPGETW